MNISLPATKYTREVCAFFGRDSNGYFNCFAFGLITKNKEAWIGGWSTNPIYYNGSWGIYKGRGFWGWRKD